MNSLSNTDSLFGPLNKNYCFYFYVLSVVGLISLVLLVLTTLFIGVSSKKTGTFYLQMISVAIVYGMMYLQNRLLFNMCNNSL
jgi:hypothetical protein